MVRADGSNRDARRPDSTSAGSRGPGAGDEGAGPRGEAIAALSFEAALAELETVVDRLEDGELSLEAAVAAFEQGTRLSQHCAEQLSGAERRVEILMQEGGELVGRPFSEVIDDGLVDDGQQADDTFDGSDEAEEWE